MTSNSAVVVWVTAAASAIHSFQVQQREGRLGRWEPVGESGDSMLATSAYRRAVLDLRPEARYCFRIRALRPQRGGSFSATRCVTTPSRPDPPASLMVSVRAGPVAAGSICSGPLVWTFLPVRLRGNTGEAVAFSVERYDEVGAEAQEDGRWYCFFKDSLAADRLRPGRWQIRVQGTEWGTRCDVALRRGAQRANFTQHRSGCELGADFP